MAGLLNKDTCLRGLSWVTTTQAISCTHLPNLMWDSQLGLGMYPVPIISSPHDYFRAASLGQLLGVGKASEHTFQREESGWRDSSRSGPAWGSNQRSSLLEDLPQHTPLSLYSSFLFWILVRRADSTQNLFAYVNKIVLLKISLITYKHTLHFHHQGQPNKWKFTSPNFQLYHFF